MSMFIEGLPLCFCSETIFESILVNRSWTSAQSLFNVLSSIFELSEFKVSFHNVYWSFYNSLLNIRYSKDDNLLTMRKLNN